MRFSAATTSAKRSRRLRIGASSGAKSVAPNAVAPATVTWANSTSRLASSGVTVRPPAGGTSISARGRCGTSCMTSRPITEGEATGAGVIAPWPAIWARASGALKLSATAPIRTHRIQTSARDTGGAQDSVEQPAVGGGRRRAAVDRRRRAAVGAVGQHLGVAEHRRRQVDRGGVVGAVGRGGVGAEQAGRAAASSVGADQGAVQERRAARGSGAGGGGRIGHHRHTVGVEQAVGAAETVGPDTAEAGGGDAVGAGGRA